MDRTAISATPERAPTRRARLALFVSAALLVVVCACEGDRGKSGGPAPTTGGSKPTPTDVALGEEAPILDLRVLALGGASGPGGEFQVGDRITVRFELRRADGGAWSLDELSYGEVLVSGPTFNYQRVIPLATDLLTASVAEDVGRFAYTLDPIPPVYAAPYNDTPTFGEEAGELTGRPLLDGTYTIGLSVGWDYTADGDSFQQVGGTTMDFLVGTGAGALTSREVSSIDNCNQCHVDVQAHEGRYRGLKLCLLCHTAGAEDLNDPAIARGTRTVTIDSRVMFHRIHNGRHLPSVLGVSTRTNGLRNYNDIKRRYRIVSTERVAEFTNVGWPVMPNRGVPLARDIGYRNKSAEIQAIEDIIRSGAANCSVCHGDPDGPGPLGAPAQGDDAYALMSRKACGSCHDDVDFTKLYQANGRTMPPQSNDAGCQGCHHLFSGLSPILEHVHPTKQSNLFRGLNIEIQSVVESGANDGDGTFDPGESIAVTLRITDDQGNEVVGNSVERLRALIAGPTSNYQVLLDTEIDAELWPGVQPATIVLPERHELELLGTASSASGEVFFTSRSPIRVLSNAKLFVRSSSTGASSSTIAAAFSGEPFIDVADGSLFARGQAIVIDDDVIGLEEYARIEFVDENRLWFSAPENPRRPTVLKSDHQAAATVEVVVLTELTVGVDYALNAPLGRITERTEFGDGNEVLLSYTSDFVIPETYPEPLNGSPDLGDETGKWAGKSIQGGTYTLALTASRTFTLGVRGVELTHYEGTSPASTIDLLFGSATSLEPYTRILGQSCNACHKDLTAHAGTERGFETCILCHGAPGTEDLPRYTAANAPETSRRTVDFRSMLHRLHRGARGADASYSVVGSGPRAYPNNFVERSFSKFRFPAQPSRTMQCEVCHVDLSADSVLPSDRAHPSEQLNRMNEWGVACGSCHDSSAEIAHIEAQTAPSGAESCLICHDIGEDDDAVLAHMSR